MTAVAIIGAGAAGLAAARRLHAAQIRPTLFDKGRNPGGRLASRDTAVGRFDHGPDRLHLRPEAAPMLADAVRAGLLEATSDSGEPWRARPDLRSLASYWAEGLDVRCQRRVTAVRSQAGRPQLHFAEGEPACFDAVIVTVPLPQAAALLPEFADRLAQFAVRYDPCWTLMWAPSTRFSADPPPMTSGDWLQALVAQGANPGDTGRPRYVIHASAEYSRRHLDADPVELRQSMLAALAQYSGWPVRPEQDHAQAHLWRYARRRSPGELPCWWLSPQLYLAGDSFLRDVGGAVASGEAAAGLLLASGL